MLMVHINTDKSTNIAGKLARSVSTILQGCYKLLARYKLTVSVSLI